MLIGARVTQGVGAALLLPGTLAIIAHAFPGKSEQARAIGIWAGVGSVALPAGPLLGGALIQAFGWRAVFLLNVPIVTVAALVVARVVTDTTRDRTRRLDRPGVILAGLFLTAVTFGFIQAGHAGLGPTVIAAIVIAVLLAVAFVAAERSQSDPMLPLGLFARRDFSTANTVAGIMNLGTLGLLFLLTLYLQTVQHRSALAAGVAVLPLFLPLGVLAPLAGRLTARIGPKLPMAAGLLCAAAGVGLLARLQPQSTYATLLPAMLAMGDRNRPAHPRGRGCRHPLRRASQGRPGFGGQQHVPPSRRRHRDRRLRCPRRHTDRSTQLRRRLSRCRAHHRSPLRCRHHRHRHYRVLPRPQVTPARRSRWSAPGRSAPADSTTNNNGQADP